MKKLSDVVKNPSGFDSLANYAGEVPADSWLSVLTRTRDSDCLAESNFACALEALGGEGDNVQVFRFGHWACGWWEALAVKEGSPQEAIAEGIQNRLADYPVLNDEDFSEREMEEANLVWRDCYSASDRVAYVRKFRSQFEFHDWRDMRACIRGDYFAGYASELIG